MAKREAHLKALEQFLPAGTFEKVLPFFRRHAIHLTLTRERKSVLGDYRTPTRDQPAHRISININLNPYSFLITLLHELAHLETFLHFGNKASPHGPEWKTQFRHLLLPFTGQGIFPVPVEKALSAYLHNPKASTCTDPGLYKALRRYDAPRPGWQLVESLEPGQHFEIEDGRRFEALTRLRTRMRCREISTGRHYFFQNIAEVAPIAAGA